MSNNEPMVTVKDLYKSFRLPHEQHSGLKQVIIDIFRNKKKLGDENQEVLKNVSFEIEKGEFFGIVGRNGSGKSTLLKLLAGIYVPDKGLVQVNGSLTPFIELGVGFNPELTGRENIFLNGALLGFGRKEMEAMYDSIVEFAELEKFMDQKLKNYSSGMQVRLAFSIAIRANSDILLIDEVLAVGDAAFQQKCFQYFDELKKSKRTIILVTHDMGAVRQFCDRAMLINNGRMELIGEPSDISARYESINYSTDGSKEIKKSNSDVDYKIVNHAQRETTSFAYGEEITLSINWQKSNYKVGMVGVIVYKGNEAVFATNTENSTLSFSHKEVNITYNTELGNGRYRFNIVLFGNSEHDILQSFETGVIAIYQQPKYNQNKKRTAGIIDLDHKWSE